MFRIKKARTKKRLLAVAIAALLLLPLLWWENNGLMSTSYDFQSANLPVEFEGYRIAQISDLHNCLYGQGQEWLLGLTREAKPDCIVVTGDLIENNRIDNSLTFLKKAVQIAPVYYTPGNHEANAPLGYARLKALLPELGVTILEDESTIIQKGNSAIELLGIRDPAFWTEGKLSGGVSNVSRQLAKLVGPSAVNGMSETDKPFRILLSHRPEMMELYAKENMDLVFAGHTHGGLIRLPGIGAPYGLNQGFLPKYTEGIHYKDGTAMVISRGLGNNFIGQRINNRPELVVVELHRSISNGGTTAAAQR